MEPRESVRVVAEEGEAMAVVLVDASRRLGKLTDLMAKGLGVVVGKGLAAAVAVGGAEVLEPVDLLDRGEIASMTRGLGRRAPPFPAGLRGRWSDAGTV
jgi:hypothetical protein